MFFTAHLFIIFGHQLCHTRLSVCVHTLYHRICIYFWYMYFRRHRLQINCGEGEAEAEKQKQKKQ